jgi:hypothetical protein
MLGRDDAKHLACFFINILFFLSYCYTLFILREVDE